jgi:heterodisulfide reductase subunit A-like polyferredoxin
MELIRAAVARARNLEPLKEDTYKIINDGLVIGGGLAGMTAALTMAEQGFHVHLVEKDRSTGWICAKPDKNAGGSFAAKACPFSGRPGEKPSQYHLISRRVNFPNTPDISALLTES